MKEYIVNLADISEYGRRMIIGNGIPKEDLIRCKDCKWWSADTCMEWYDTPYTPADGYCFRAKRKEE